MLILKLRDDMQRFGFVDGFVQFFTRRLESQAINDKIAPLGSSQVA